LVGIFAWKPAVQSLLSNRDTSTDAWTCLASVSRLRLPFLSVTLGCSHRTFSLHDPEGTTAHGLSVPFLCFIVEPDPASLCGRLGSSDALITCSAREMRSFHQRATLIGCLLQVQRPLVFILMIRKRWVTCWVMVKSDQVRYPSDPTLAAILVGVSDLLIPFRWAPSTRLLSLRTDFLSVALL